MTRGLIASYTISAALLLTGAPATPAVAQGQPLIFLGPCGEDGYRPVCARARGNVLVTYANACIARSEGARVVGQQPCPVACPMVYRPVCATDPAGKRRTYGNDCQAKAAGARIVRRGRCLFS